MATGACTAMTRRGSEGRRAPEKGGGFQTESPEEALTVPVAGPSVWTPPAAEIPPPGLRGTPRSGSHRTGRGSLPQKNLQLKDEWK